MSAPPPSPPIPQRDDGDVGQAQGNYRQTGQQHRGMYTRGTSTAITTTAAMTTAITMATVAPLSGPLPTTLPPPLPYSHLDSRHQAAPPARAFYPEAPQPHPAGPQQLLHRYSGPDEQDTESPIPYTLPPPQQQPPQPGPGLLQPHYGHAYSVAARPHDLEPISVRSQRKTKGHVASACVPCKKAHLRCDAQRPCTRCMGNGKEQACIDVQHKKRGRPRLRENAYDQQRLSMPPDDLRRPLSAYTTKGSVGAGAGTVSGAAIASAPRYDDPSRGRQYRVLKSQVGDRPGPRFLDQAQMSDANVVSSPISAGAQVPEPVAYLSMRLDIIKASPTFLDLLAPGGVGAGVVGHVLENLVVSSERERALMLQRRIQDEQSRKEPNYLPPIFGREQADRVMQSLGFGIDEVSQFQLDHEEFLSFSVHSNGPPKSLRVRLGLAKRESTYFVVLLLVPNAPALHYPHPTYPSSSSHPTDQQHPFYPHHHQQHHQQHQQHLPAPFQPPQTHQQPHQTHQQQHAFAQHTTGPMVFESQRSSAREGALPHRQSMSTLGRGFSQGAPSYSPSPNRPDYPTGLSSFQIPRSELAPVSNQPASQPLMQLPPIRSPQPPPSSADASWPREERHGRVDIGGLIEKPEQPRRT